jgi:hypothetical protein
MRQKTLAGHYQRDTMADAMKQQLMNEWQLNDETGSFAK